MIMSARIVLTAGNPPGDQIRDQLRGLITSGILGAHERLPSVRQLASDLEVAPGTVAKVYKLLETEGLVVTRIGGGTRVSADAHTTPLTVLEAARHLASLGISAGMEHEDVANVLGAVWQAQEHLHEQHTSPDASTG